MAGIKELMAKIESDAAFRESIQGAADKDELMDKIKAAGFDTTFEEFSKAVAAQNGELSDDELEGAAGGKFGKKPYKKPDFADPEVKEPEVEVGRIGSFGTRFH